MEYEGKHKIYNPQVRNLDLNDPEIRKELEEHARVAKEFSQKFVKARILDPKTMFQPMTI